MKENLIEIKKISKIGINPKSITIQACISIYKQQIIYNLGCLDLQYLFQFYQAHTNNYPYNKIYMIAAIAPLKDVFKNDAFAWQILQEEIKLDSEVNISGEDIAKLLGLYMRGVQTLNSLRDPRELYFRNRLNTLMMRPNVVRVLSSDSKRQNINQAQKQEVKAESALGQYRKGQLQMKLTYAKQEHNQQKLKNLVTQHTSKISTITSTVTSNIQKSRSKLEDRINQRKLKSATARQRSLATNQQKLQKVQRNNMEVLDEIKQQYQQKQYCKRAKQRRHSLDLKQLGNYSSIVVETPARRISLLLPSRKGSESLLF